MAKLQVMTLANLQTYHGLLTADVQAKINAAVTPAIKTVSQSEDGYTLYFYTKTAPVTVDEAAFSIQLPSPVDISGKADKVKNAVAGDLAALDANGNLTDSGKKLADLAEASTVSDLAAKVGTIPADSASTTVVEYAKEVADAAQAAATYDDSELRSKVNANTSAINVLNGTGAGSVAKQVADAVASIVADAPEAYDTLKEISDWISSHSSDAAAMNSQINTNKDDIAALEALVGELPEGAASQTIVAYIQEYVTKALEDSDLSQYAKASDLTAAVARITKNESDIAAAKKAADDAQADVDALEVKVGDIPADATATTVIGYVDEKVAAVKSETDALKTRMSAAEGKITTLEGNMTQAQSDISGNKSDIAALKALVGDGVEAIPTADIEALFNN